MESHNQAAAIKERIVDIAKLECPSDITRELARIYDYDPLIGVVWLQSGNSFLRWNIVTFSDENLFKIWTECFDEIVSPRITPPMNLSDEFLKLEFPRYPQNILADRLEDMGYGDTHQELLDHLRTPKTHGPYCWAVEKIFGRIA